jgi:6-pyruvoyltetrahydropterin/6-carboxytetrahydropterin synthase
MPEFRVRVCGDDLVFSAAHFITFAGGCEPLHGHDYRVAAEVSAALGPDQCVVDFLALSQLLKTILRGWDHAVLLPAAHPSIRVAAAASEVEVTLDQRRWVFPRAECRLLPLANTTAELLAEHLALRLREALRPELGDRPLRVRIELQESPGRVAVCEA